MTDKDDQKWLNALAGKPDSQADPLTNVQAAAVRAAMIARRSALEQATASADPVAFERLQARLRREGLLRDANAEAPKGVGAWLVQWLPLGNGGAVPLPTWSLAANMVLAVVVVVQSGLLATGSADNDANVLRGGEVTVLLVANPEARLSELSAGLNAAKVQFVVRRKPSGLLHVIVQEGQAAFDYLDAQRIEPKWAEGIAVIELRKP
jgi:hypothetical protein